MRGRVVCSFILVKMGRGILIMTNPTNQVAAGEPQKPASQNLKIDLSKAVEVALPQPKAGLQPAAFKTSDGKSGWVVRIPGGRPIAAPAYADGMVFVGGGYGSHEFYSFGAETGHLGWEIQNGYGGPTAGQGGAGYAAFHTESFTLTV